MKKIILITCILLCACQSNSFSLPIYSGNNADCMSANFTEERGSHSDGVYGLIATNCFNNITGETKSICNSNNLAGVRASLTNSDGLLYNIKDEYCYTINGEKIGGEQ